MESIHIKDFRGIEEMTLEINKINILIGPQASGKSVTAKLIYFFKKVPTFISTPASQDLQSCANKPMPQHLESSVALIIKKE